MNKVLIIGINGFVGSYLKDELLNHGYVVTGSDLAPNQCGNDDMTYMKIDITNYENTKNAIKECSPDIIINLAAISSVKLSWDIPQKTIDVNTIGALNILEAVRSVVPNCKLLFIGSSEEYAPSLSPISEENALNPSSPYCISKITQESFCSLYSDLYDMDITIARSFNHTGIGQPSTFVLPSFCKQISQIEDTCTPSIIHVGDVSVYRDFSDVRDIVRAYRLIVEKDFPGEVFNVGSGQTHQLKELLDHIITYSKKNIEVVVDEDLLRPIDNPYMVCNHKKLSLATGWEPIYDITQTLEEMYLWYEGQRTR